MTRASLFLVSALILVAELPATAGDRVEICHFLPGGSGAKSITVSAQSAERHMIEHGDHVGSCLVGAIPLSKVYVTSLSANYVIVFNGDTYTQIDTLATKKAPYRAFASPGGEYVFIPNFNSSSVSVVSTADDTVVADVSVGGGPSNVVFSPDATMAYVYNSRVNSVSVVRTSDFAVTPDSQFVYVVNGSAPVSVIRTSDHTVINNVGNSLGWESIAVTPDGQFVFTVGNSQYVQVISTATNTVVARVPIGGTTRYAATSSDGARVFVTNLDSLNVIQTSDNSLVSKVNTGSGSDTSGVVAVDIP